MLPNHPPVWWDSLQAKAARGEAGQGETVPAASPGAVPVAVTVPAARSCAVPAAMVVPATRLWPAAEVVASHTVDAAAPVLGHSLRLLGEA